MSDETELLAPGTIVRLKSDPGRQGVITGKNRMQAGIRKYQVAFPEGKTFQPEYELEVIDDNSDWGTLLEQGKFGRVRELRRNLTHIHLSGRLANLVYSMDATNTDFYAYQYKPVLSFLESPSNGLLIADEVGLGKTIEAGLIWTELRARYDARRLLVVCPAMLQEKWCSELNNRFGVDAEIMNAGQLHQHLRQNKNEIKDGKGIVCSIQGLRPPKGWRNEKSQSSPRNEFARFLDEESDNEPLIDLVIIDEAHYLRNPESQTAKLGRFLRGVAENIVLLSATPINLSDDDLYHLLNLVDPDSFGVKEVFPQVLSANEHLQKARDFALDIRVNSNEILAELSLASKHSLLSSSTQLAELVSGRLLNIKLEDKSERIRLANQIEKINLLSHAIARTRKAEVMEWRVVREPVKKFVEFNEDGPEWEFYQAVTETIRKYAWDADISDGFLLAGPQRQVSSCMYAAAKAWMGKIEGYQEQVYEDFGFETDTKYELSPMMERLKTEVLAHTDVEKLRTHDSKYKLFRETIIEFLDKHPDEKIIVFSFYRKTLGYLSERLQEERIKSQVLIGGMKESKQDVIDRFRKSSDLQVLLSSEVASEGVDLQFCRVLVNYDLPWNPMKVEQRIGRIDRIGQTADKISIINLLYANTIDHKIHEKLYSRLKIFERALGGMEAILGEEIAELTSDLLSKPLTSEQETIRVEKTAMAIEKIRQDKDALEQQASHLIAHGGYILDEVQAAHNFKKRITEQDLVTYVKDYLDKFCQGFEFHQLNTDEQVYDIRLPANMSASFVEFIKHKKLYGQTRLASGELVRCVFANKVRDPQQKNETISQFHPLVRFISQELITKDEAFYPLVSLQSESNGMDELKPGVYVFFVHRWVFSGIKVEEELPVRAIHMGSGTMLNRDLSWTLLNHARVIGTDWLEVDSVLNIENVFQEIEHCDEQLVIDYESNRKQRNNENTDRVNFQIESAERHRDRQLQSHMATLEKLQNSGNTRMLPLTKGRIRKVQESFNVQQEKLRQKSNLKTSQFEVCCGVINWL